MGIVLSDKVLDDILKIIEILPTIPSMGSTDVAAALAYEYGEGVRKIPVGPFDIVIFYEDEADRVTVLGLVPPACCLVTTRFPEELLQPWLKG